jgi:hypothetical protein
VKAFLRVGPISSHAPHYRRDHPPDRSTEYGGY